VLDKVYALDNHVRLTTRNVLCNMLIFQSYDKIYTDEFLIYGLVTLANVCILPSTFTVRDQEIIIHIVIFNKEFHIYVIYVYKIDNFVQIHICN